MYSVDQLQASHKVPVTPKIRRNMLRFLHLRRAHAGQNIVKKMTQSGAAHNLDMSTQQPPTRCPLCIKGTMTNTKMKSQANLKRTTRCSSLDSREQTPSTLSHLLTKLPDMLGSVAWTRKVAPQNGCSYVPVVLQLAHKVRNISLDGGK